MEVGGYRQRWGHGETHSTQTREERKGFRESPTQPVGSIRLGRPGCGMHNLERHRGRRGPRGTRWHALSVIFCLPARCSAVHVDPRSAEVLEPSPLLRRRSLFSHTAKANESHAGLHARASVTFAPSRVGPCERAVPTPTCCHPLRRPQRPCLPLHWLTSQCP